MRVLGDLERLTTKFMALEQENQRLLGDLQQVNVEKAQQHEELTQRVHQLEAALITLRQQALQAPNSTKEPKISLPSKFDGTRSQFRGFLNQVRLDGNTILFTSLGHNRVVGLHTEKQK